MALVVDASAVGALVFGEPRKPWVSRINDDQLIAPRLLIEQTTANIGGVERLVCLTARYEEPSDPTETTRIAHRHSLTFYGASYLWLANHHRAGRISLDVRLARAARRLGLTTPLPDDAGQTAPRARS